MAGRSADASSPTTRILLVDDDAELAELLGEYLRREGFALDDETDPTRALDRLARGGYQLAVLDVMLPGPNGFEVLRRLARRGGVLITLTAVEFTLLEVLMRAAGAVVKRDDLARRALGRSLLPFDRSIDVHVSHVRKKLGPRPDGGERIATLRAVGYLYTRQSAGPA